MQEGKIEALKLKSNEADQIFKTFNERAKRYNTDAARNNKSFINDLVKA